VVERREKPALFAGRLRYFYGKKAGSPGDGPALVLQLGGAARRYVAAPSLLAPR
jgi:hypothetical protein